MNLNNIREGELKEILDVLERAFQELGIDHYLIGAIAREVWYTDSGIELRRTKDIDFAVLVADNEEYRKVKQYLVTHEGFTDSRENAFVVISPEKVQVDILPFGAIAVEGAIHVNGTGLTNIDVEGFWEVHQAGTQEVVLTTGHHFKVATLAAIVLLKFIAFDDRPEMRLKDARDIANIILNYFELQSNLIYDGHADLFTAANIDDLSLEEIGAIVIGREIKAILTINEALGNRVRAIVANHIEQAEKSMFIRNMVDETETDVATMIKWLKAIEQGLS